MPAKIRLQRHGKKGKAFYYIVAADGRAKRDGRYIERFGSYNPNTNPATIEMDFDRALYWVKQGAQPTDTMRAMLSYRGVLYKNHLDRGVLKGAFTQEEADKRFAKWMEEKQGKIDAKAEGLDKKAAEERKARLAAEKAVSDARAAAQVPQEEVAEEAAPAEASAEETAPAEETKAEAPAEEAKAEAPAEEAKAEAPAEEAKAEAPAEEAAPADKAEAKEEAPAEEAKTEAPAEEAKAEEAAPEAKAEETPAEDKKEEEEKKD